MERNSIPVEMALGILVIAGILLVGSTMSPKQFRSDKPSMNGLQPIAAAQVETQYQKLVAAREARAIKRNGTVETAIK